MRGSNDRVDSNNIIFFKSISFFRFQKINNVMCLEMDLPIIKTNVKTAF